MLMSSLIDEGKETTRNFIYVKIMYLFVLSKLEYEEVFVCTIA